MRRREAPEGIERHGSRASVRVEPRVRPDAHGDVDDGGEEREVRAEDRVGFDGGGGGDRIYARRDPFVVAGFEASRRGVDARGEYAREKVRDDQEVPAALQGERRVSQRARG